MVKRTEDWIKQNITVDRIILIVILIFQIGKAVSNSDLSVADLQANMKNQAAAFQNHVSYAEQTYVRKDVEQEQLKEIQDKLNFLVEQQKQQR